MKYAAVLAFAVFAFLAQADAKSVSLESVDRGAIVNGLKSALETVQDKLDDLFEFAHDYLKFEIEELKKKAVEIVGQLTVQGIEYKNDLFEAAQKLLDRFGVVEDKAVAQFKKYISKYGPKTEQTEQVESAQEQ